jgi:hypothetical protein
VQLHRGEVQNYEGQICMKPLLTSYLLLRRCRVWRFGKVHFLELSIAVYVRSNFIIRFRHNG